jgi:hypothetical protein
MNSIDKRSQKANKLFDLSRVVVLEEFVDRIQSYKLFR